MALSLCRTTVDDSARELMEHGTAAFPIACYHDDLQAEPVPWHDQAQSIQIELPPLAAVWMALASGFSFYLTLTPGYTVTYGTLAGVMITLMFFYLTGATIIYGAEFNAALNRIGFDPVQDKR